MSEFFVGQIMLTGFGFAPRYFAQCNGQLLALSQNQVLFSLLGTQYGGDGRSTFALPDLRGRVPVGSGESADPGWQPTPYPVGEASGVESVMLTGRQMPAHVHMLAGTTGAGGQRSPQGCLYGSSGSEALYGTSSGAQVPMTPQNLGVAGGDTPHANMQPFQAINYVIALAGIFPSRS